MARRPLHAKRENHNIILSDTETQIFDTLEGARDHHGLKTTLRCAGGWVRDKLLGRESHDIDIALDDITGHEFGKLVAQYQVDKGLPAAKVAVIAANPEQSKHLETATMLLCGLSLDLVNLRSEHYSSASRIPVIEIGTPQQDAQRRDFTVNSLFFNLNTRAVEDFTGRGLADLEEGIIRTPLEPRVTFMDDPLRVLRAVRFASRYQFAIVEDIKVAAATDEVLKALELKVAAERVGAEIAGCFQGPQPALAASYLLEFGAFAAIFKVPESVAAAIGPAFGRPCVRSLELGQPLLHGKHLLESDTEKRVGFMAALLLPLRSFRVPLKNGKSEALSKHIIKTSLKWKASDADAVALLHSELPVLNHLHRQAQGLSATELADIGATRRLRSDLGCCAARLKALTRHAVALFPLLNHTATAPLAATDGPGGDAFANCAPLREVSVPEMEAASQQLHSVLDAWGLWECHSWRPLIDGKQMVSALELGAPGPVVGKLAALAKEWQYAHPDFHPAAMKNSPPGPPKELVEYLKQERTKLVTVS